MSLRPRVNSSGLRPESSDDDDDDMPLRGQGGDSRPTTDGPNAWRGARLQPLPRPTFTAPAGSDAGVWRGSGDGDAHGRALPPVGRARPRNSARDTRVADATRGTAKSDGGIGDAEVGVAVNNASRAAKPPSPARVSAGTGAGAGGPDAGAGIEMHAFAPVTGTHRTHGLGVGPRAGMRHMGSSPEFYDDTDAGAAYLVGHSRGRRARRARMRRLMNKSLDGEPAQRSLRTQCIFWLTAAVAAVVVLVVVLHFEDREVHDTDGPDPKPLLLNVNMTIEQLRAYCARLSGEVTALRAKAIATGGVPALLGLGNDMDTRLGDMANLGYFMFNVHPDPDVREVAEECYEMSTANATALALDAELYAAFRALSDSRVVRTPADSVRYLNKTLEKFRRSGVDQSDANRAALRALDAEITALGSTFESNINSDTRWLHLPASDPSLVAGLPAEFVAEHTSAGVVSFSTDYPDYFPVMQYCHNATVRRNLSALFHNRGFPSNIPVLDALLEKRAQYASMVGYPTWAAFSQANKMARNPANVRSFLQHVVSLAKPISDADIASLLTYKRRNVPNASTIDVSDSSYYSNLARQELFSVDAQVVRSYFTYARVQQGLFRVASRVFELRFVDVTREVQTWHDDVSVFDVYEAGESLTSGFMGRMYLDMHPRPNKYKHAASFPILSGVEFGPSAQATQVALVCNFPRTGPMEHSQVVTFFHEFGHLVHNLVGGIDQTYAVFSGVATEWDFVEAPSQMFEEWAWDTETLQQFAKNPEGKVIPSTLVADMRLAEKYGVGMRTMQQAFYATLSLDLYTMDPVGINTTAVTIDLQGQLSPYPYETGTHFQCSFGHLVGYSSDYYTYLWSLVIAKDMFATFQREGLYNDAVDDKYTKKVLLPGGRRNAALLVADFLGRPYNSAAFDAWLSSATSAV